MLQYNGQRVKLFADMLSDGSFEAFWTDEAGTVNLSVIRNTAGKITAIESISAEQSLEYHSAAVAFEQNILKDLEKSSFKKSSFKKSSFKKK